jgi:hypothetical protein
LNDFVTFPFKIGAVLRDKGTFPFKVGVVLTDAEAFLSDIIRQPTVIGDRRGDILASLPTKPSIPP